MILLSSNLPHAPLCPAVRFALKCPAVHRPLCFEKQLPVRQQSVHIFTKAEKSCPLNKFGWIKDTTREFADVVDKTWWRQKKKTFIYPSAEWIDELAAAAAVTEALRGGP